MTNNITLELTDDLLKKTKYLAARENKSVADWITDLIHSALSNDIAYQEAKFKALKILEKGFDLGGKKFSRNEIYNDI